MMSMIVCDDEEKEILLQKRKKKKKKNSPEFETGRREKIRFSWRKKSSK
jgi:hypothetical protein